LLKWCTYCWERNINPFSPSLSEVLSFLTLLFSTGIGYSALNTARSALSTFIVCDNLPIGKHPLVCRFLQGVFNQRPSLPRNNVTWDVSIVLRYLQQLWPISNLSLKELTIKCVMLLALTTGQRAQSIHLINTVNITLTNSYLKIRFGDLLKHSRPGHHQHEILLPAFTDDITLCIVYHIYEYLIRTEPLRGECKQLFVSYIKPHKAVSKCTISRWIKILMRKAGIDMTVFTPHSTRGASTSAMARSGIPLKTIMQTAGWTNEHTFAVFYNRPLE